MGLHTNRVWRPYLSLKSKPICKEAGRPMHDPNAPKRKMNKKDIVVPRTFMTPAYFEEIEKGVYGLFRDVTVETDQKGEDGNFLREKWGKRIGPVYTCRVATQEEEPDFTTSLPDGTVLLLKKISGPTGQ